MLLGFPEHERVPFYVLTRFSSLMVFLKNRNKEVKCAPPSIELCFTLTKFCASFLGIKLLHLAKRYTVNK
jgi:hypothetical protein